MQTVTSPVQERLDVVRHFYSLWDVRPFDSAPLEPLIKADYVDHHRPQSDPTLTDRQVIIGLAGDLAMGFPDGQHNVEVIEAAGEDLVVVYWRFTGTQTGPTFGFPATGKRVDFYGTDLLRVRDGQIVEQWHIEQLGRMIKQLTGQG